ncbi:unnamed protein product [Orchesella dallaii]|uniref:N-alpha-acetyltransferase 60 n=1 Tax=Orchesella dallaii TaxID=48710 RepID=A0ABP1R8D3_9HEXA
MSNFSFYAPLDKGPACYQNASTNGLYVGHTATQYLLSAATTKENGKSDSRCSLISSTDSNGSSLGSVRSDTSVLSSSLESKKALISNQVQLRFLNPGDYETVKKLCEEWFPVEYPAKWFEAITSDTNLFSLAAVLDGTIVGLIVAELKQGKDLNREDRDILCDSQLKYTAAYILSLGVVDANRRQGIGSLLLSSLLDHLSTLQCKAVFLHVLTSNDPALHFYEKHRFRVHKFLPYYYSIGGRARDGFTYVLYLNGGHGPWGFHEYVQHLCEVTAKEVCSFPHWFANQVRRIVHSIITFVR